MKILVSAYACEPDKGSEAGVGWNWAKLISKKHETWIITRQNNRSVIEQELARNPNPRLHFEYVDLPKWVRFWKKGPRRVRTYYYLWQFAALRRALKLDRKIRFDYGHHVTFVNNWLWTFFALTSIPFIWGPIGSNDPIKREFLVRGKDLIKDRMATLFRSGMRLTDPLYWLSCWRSRTVLVINKQNLKIIPLRWLAGKKLRVEPAIGAEKLEQAHNQRESNIFSVLFVGRFIAIKQPDLALDAFAAVASRIDGARLTLLGQGPQEQNLRDKAQQYGISNKIRFISWLPREEALRLMETCDVLLFPSMEGGGMVVMEAMALGKPVVALNLGGPGEFVDDTSGIKIPLTKRQQVVNDIAAALERLATDQRLLRQLSHGAKLRAKRFLWENKEPLLDSIYRGPLRK